MPVSNALDQAHHNVNCISIFTDVSRNNQLTPYTDYPYILSGGTVCWKFTDINHISVGWKFDTLMRYPVFSLSLTLTNPTNNNHDIWLFGDVNKPFLNSYYYHRELVTGDKEHKLLRRALLKEIAMLEEEERRKVSTNYFPSLSSLWNIYLYERIMVANV